MATVKISNLPAAAAATSIDVVPIVQGGTTKKLTFGAFLTSPTLFGSGVSTFLASPSSGNLNAALTNKTGSGLVVFDTGATMSSPTLNSPTATTPTVSSGNLTFSGTAQRITGDFSNATIADRLMFQSSTANGATGVALIPNGSSTDSSLTVSANSDPANATIGQIRASASGVVVASTRTGAGSFVPLSFQTGGATQLVIETNNNVRFPAIAQRITGDLNNATLANSLMFQTSATNGASYVNVLPNGTASAAGFRAFASSSDPGNASIFQTRIALDNSQCALYSTITGTGTYLPMTFYTGGSERIRVDTSGNVGIGSSPGVSGLDVQRASGTVAIRAAQNDTGAGTFAQITAVKASGANVEMIVDQSNAYVGTTGSFPLLFRTNSSERMRIATSGNVGIGTASPGYLLHLNQNGNTQVWISATNAGSNSAGIGFENAGQRNWQIWADRTNDALQFGNNSRATVNMRIDSSGNVNIATAGARITGDFSNATPGNRVAFQTSTTNGETGILFIPNGTATASTLALLNTSNTTDFSFARLQCTSTAFTISATRGGTGTYLPIEFQTNGIKRGSIEVNGNFVVGQQTLATNATEGFLWIPSCAGVPTGAPTAPYTDAAAMVVDTTNSRLYVRVGTTWKYATLV